MHKIKRRRWFGSMWPAAVATAVAARVFRGGPARARERDEIAGFDHVSAPLRDLDAMARFYRALGFDVRIGERIVSVHCGDHKINFHRPELWQDPQFTLRAPASKPPCGDFCFVWTGSGATLEERLAQAGASTLLGPVKRQGGRSGGTVEGVSVYTRDPDGNLLEFLRYP